MNLAPTSAPRTAPTDFATLREVMLNQRKSLPKRIAQVAAYSLDNPDEIAFGTAASIAADAGVQPSTLIRFAQHFGFDGFTSLQLVFRERLRDRNSFHDERLKALRASDHVEGKSSVLEGFVSASAESLNNLAGGLVHSKLATGVEILTGAETIYIVARRRSFPVASYLSYSFGTLKIRNVLVNSSGGLEPETISFASPRDALIAVSFSPYAPDTVAYARSLSERGVPVVSITDSAFSPLSEFSKVWFEVVESNFAGFRSLSASMALAATLSVSVADARKARKDGAGK